MKRGLLIEAAGALAVLLILLFTAWEIRNFLIFIAVLACLLAISFGGAFATLALFKYYRRYEKINVRSEGGYIQKHGRIVRLDPLQSIESYDIGNNVIDVSPPPFRLSQKHTVEEVEDEYDDEELEPIALPAPRQETKELTAPVSEELKAAQTCWRSGAQNRERMAESMREVGYPCTRAKATELIKELRERKMI